MSQNDLRFAVCSRCVCGSLDLPWSVRGKRESSEAPNNPKVRGQWSHSAWLTGAASQTPSGLFGL
jgi:hypothetical protein